MIRGTRFTAIRLGVLGVLGACSSLDARPPHLPLHDRSIMNSVLISGELTRHGQCLFLASDDGSTYGVAWPADRTTWDAGANRLVVGKLAAAPGDHVELGAAHEDDLDGLAVAPLPECMGDSFIYAGGFASVGATD